MKYVDFQKLIMILVFLVSCLCQIIDKKLMQKESVKPWSLSDVDKAVCKILEAQNTNFDSLITNLQNNSDLQEMIHGIIINGMDLKFNIDHPQI